MHAVDIIIPTWNNYQYLSATLQSILRTKASEGLFHIHVINNGNKNSCDFINNPDVTVHNTGENLGWEGGILYGLNKTKAPYVLFLNDDILIPQSSSMWLNKLLQAFNDPAIGATGPSSNVVMGPQNIFTDSIYSRFEVSYLIGFCFLVRREAIMKAGGIDTTLPGGDDLDMSIRLRDAGYSLVCNRDVFVYHHGFKTGNRVMGDAQKRNGWNSFEHLEKTNLALIKKHGFKKWWECLSGGYRVPQAPEFKADDIEGDLIRERIKGETVLDLGCGGNKTIESAIGVDMIPGDEKIDTLRDTKSSADVNADVSKPLPFDEKSVDTIVARHILEHLEDSVEVLTNWKKVLKVNGRLIIAVPNNNIIHSVPMNIEHVHGFSMKSMKSLLELVGFNVVEQFDGQNGVSFITVAERV